MSSVFQQYPDRPDVFQYGRRNPLPRDELVLLRDSSQYSGEEQKGKRIIHVWNGELEGDWPFDPYDRVIAMRFESGRDKLGWHRLEDFGVQGEQGEIWRVVPPETKSGEIRPVYVRPQDHSPRHRARDMDKDNTESMVKRKLSNSEEFEVPRRKKTVSEMYLFVMG